MGCAIPVIGPLCSARRVLAGPILHVDHIIALVSLAVQSDAVGFVTKHGPCPACGVLAGRVLTLAIIVEPSVCILDRYTRGVAVYIVS